MPNWKLGVAVALLSVGALQHAPAFLERQDDAVTIPVMTAAAALTTSCVIAILRDREKYTNHIFNHSPLPPMPSTHRRRLRSSTPLHLPQTRMISGLTQSFARLHSSPLISCPLPPTPIPLKSVYFLVSPKPQEARVRRVYDARSGYGRCGRDESGIWARESDVAFEDLWRRDEG